MRNPHAQTRARIGLDLGIRPPNLWELSSTFGGEAYAVYCAQLFERTGASQLVTRAMSQPLHPANLAELDAARRYFAGHRCDDYVRVVDQAIAFVRRASAAARVAPPPIVRPLGERRRAPGGPGLPGAPGTVLRLRAALAYATERRMDPRVVSALRSQLAVAESREASSPSSVAGIGQASGDAPSLVQRLANAAELSLRGYRALQGAAEGARYGRDALVAVREAVTSLSAARDAASSALASLGQVRRAIEPRGV